MWLTVYRVDAAGVRTRIGERHFRTVYEDASGKHPVDMWDAARIYSDDRVPPNGSTSSVYSFKMPDGADLAKVVATLEYRSLSDELAAKAHVDNPTTEMAIASKTVYSSEAAVHYWGPPPPAAAPLAPWRGFWAIPLAALAFAASVGVVSVGIMSVRKR